MTMIEEMQEIKQELRAKAERLRRHAIALEELADALPQSIPSKPGADLLVEMIRWADHDWLMKKRAADEALYTETDDHA